MRSRIAFILLMMTVSAFAGGSANFTGVNVMGLTGTMALVDDNGTITTSNPLPVSGTFATTQSGTVPVSGTVTAITGSNVAVPGGVNINALPPVTGTVSVNSIPGVTGTVSTVATGTAPVSVANLPAVQTVSGTVTAQASGTTPISGSVTVASLPPVTGTVTASPTGTANVSVISLPGVTGTVTATPSGTTNITGTVSVTSLPGVTGTVSTIPTGTASVFVVNSSSSAVTGTVTAVPSGTTPVSGTVAVSGTSTVYVVNSSTGGSVSLSNTDYATSTLQNQIIAATGSNSAILTSTIPVFVANQTSGTTTIANGTNNIGTVNVSSTQAALNTVPTYIMTPQTNWALTATGQTVQAGCDPSGYYSFAICTPALSATLTSITSCTTVIGSQTVLITPTTGLAVGQQIVGTGIPYGAYIASIVNSGTITISIPANAAGTNTLTAQLGSFTVNFEQSPDGVNWSPLTVTPKTVPSASGTVTQASNIGLFLCQPGNGINFIRGRLSALNLIPTVQVYIDTYAPNRVIHLPFLSGLTVSIPTGIATVPPIETSDIQEIDYDMQGFAGSSQTLTWYQSSDPMLTTPLAMSAALTSGAAWTFAATNTTAGAYRLVPHAAYFIAKLTDTTITTMNVGAVTAKLGPVSQQDTQQILANSTIGVGQITGQTPATQKPATNTGLCFGLMAPSFNADKASGALTSSGSVGLSTDDSGAVLTGYVIVSATAGTGSIMDLYLRDSSDNGTTWQDRWHCPRVTTTGTWTMPPVTVRGRRQWYYTISGTSPSFTTTISVSRVNVSAPIWCQYFDRSIACINGTTGNATAAYDIAGAKNISAFICLGAATAPAFYQVQVSPDSANWSSLGSPVQATANATTTIGVSTFPAAYARVLCTTSGTSQTGTYIGLNATN